MYDQQELITTYIRDSNNRISLYYKEARERSDLQKQKAKTRFEKHVTGRTPNLQLGDKVYVKKSQIKDKL